ncbi:glycosyl transferase group 1 [Gluconacetobacter diazotrophicus PA1 5]|uniref:Putative glycosyl transferase n=1 Tax=Gluconacetobacter diazotrophicus (strain ATCC 49037 / DSM 5601 / CCUG 37298 / CIP 103539 / LMG 7603 / PAl5) TaxID=272568 RepID=A9HNG0_GLUDA|nr:glycosyltransferase family 4 protein [Gluconacetobacter diazotrophicus]ACI50530.1 glycosyl transferase group 1 [Gluconacetobacter diazotrophicus PA1 5]TWB09362.1 glycosyltransferase involved in cell wall biosynthesis [Gluconacetobacter diazotrophicus]CAP56439.1 putative glycosyl transferase [Gluconacetobacter diazotrophicus PA1 5]
MTDMQRPVRAFVQLSYGYGATNWHTRWKDGSLLGVNEEYAYGYQRAAEPSFSVTQSEDERERLPGRAIRYAVRLLLGFDFVHAWRNRSGIWNSDIVWTHTEAQSMAVLLLFRLYPWRRHPRIIAQSVWLLDRWAHESRKNRLIFRALLSRADVLTFHSPCNRAAAARLFPGTRTELVEFGIRADDMIVRPPRPARQTIRVLSLGNDRHRDWETLLRATAELPCRLTIATTDPAARRRIARYGHATLASLKNNADLLALYDQADLVVVPLGPNLHASGLTTIQEAITRGVPVITTDVGGLRHYFDHDAVTYVPPGDIAALAHAITDLAADTPRQAAMTANAQRRMRECLNSQTYAARHVALSYELLTLQPDAVHHPEPATQDRRATHHYAGAVP